MDETENQSETLPPQQESLPSTDSGEIRVTFTCEISANGAVLKIFNLDTGTTEVVPMTSKVSKNMQPFGEKKSDKTVHLMLKKVENSGNGENSSSAKQETKEPWHYGTWTITTTLPGSSEKPRMTEFPESEGEENEDEQMLADNNSSNFKTLIYFKKVDNK